MNPITPAIQRKLGPAYLVLDSDVVYVVCHHWMLTIPIATGLIPYDILELIEESTTDDFAMLLRWEVLNARSIDREKNEFVIHNSKTPIPMLEANDKNISLETLHGVIERYACSLDGEVDLTEMFTEGFIEEIECRRDERKKEVHPLLFVFKPDKDKVIVVMHRYWEAILELGLTALMPMGFVPDDSAPVPPMGLVDEDSDVTGFLMCRTDSGILATEDGRILYRDLAACCWYTEEQGREFLTAENSYRLGYDDPSPFDLQKEPWVYRGQLDLGISILRIHGLSNEQIIRIYQKGRKPAFRKKYEQFEVDVAALADSLSATSRPESWKGTHDQLTTRYKQLEEVLGSLDDFGLYYLGARCVAKGA